MFIKKILNILSAIALIFTLTISTTALAIQVYPVDYTFTGFGKPGTTAVIDVTDSADKVVSFEGIVKADGTYSIPGKFATKEGQIGFKIETDEALELTAIFYDLTTLDITSGNAIAPAIYAGSGATPNANVKVEFPDGSSMITKADDKGAFEAYTTSAQLPGEVIATNLDASNLEVGTPIPGNYDGGVQVVTAAQVAKIVATVIEPPAYIAQVVTPPEVVTPNPILQNTVKPAATPVKTATVRTGGIMDYVGYISVAVIAIVTLLSVKKKATK